MKEYRLAQKEEESLTDFSQLRKKYNKPKGDSINITNDLPKPLMRIIGFLLISLTALVFIYIPEIDLWFESFDLHDIQLLIIQLFVFFWWIFLLIIGIAFFFNPSGIFDKNNEVQDAIHLLYSAVISEEIEMKDKEEIKKNLQHIINDL